MQDLTPSRPTRPASNERAGVRPPRIGIVLAGGGAKGAYQVGCLQAFRDAGIANVAAMAGTSVGAMHAVMFASEAVDAAEGIWSRTRWNDVVRVATERLHRFPLWFLAGLGSEFSPLKFWRLSQWVTHPSRWRRAVYPLSCWLTAAVLLGMESMWPVLRIVADVLAAFFIFSGLLAALHSYLRRHFLGSSFLSHAPLEGRLRSALTPEAWQRVRASRIPLVGTLSEFQPYSHQGQPWGGWVPKYVRLDQLSYDELIATLMTGAALPGFSDVTTASGHMHLDGAWTDNVPAAPLLFDSSLDLDVVFVIYLKGVVRHRLRHNSLHGVAELLITEAISGMGRCEDELVKWARIRWEAAGQRVPDAACGAVPRIVPIIPSRRVGNFFSGTLCFSPDGSKRLMALGYQDASALLEQMGLRPSAVPPTPAEAPDTRLGNLGVEAGLATS